MLWTWQRPRRRQSRLGPNPRLEAELGLVLDSYPDIRAAPDNWREAGTADYLFRDHQLLVRDAQLPRLRRMAWRLEREDNLIDGVTLLRARGRLPKLLAECDERLGVGVVTPNHVLSLSGGNAGLCPATEPEEPGAVDPWPHKSDPTGGAGVRVAVVDTGFLEEGWTKPWLAGVVVDGQDVEDPDSYPKPDGFIDPYAGHGTFIAGVVRALAPGAEVTVEQVIDRAGVVDEAKLLAQLDDALAKSPDIIAMSAGGYTRRNLPPLSFATFWEQRLRHHKGVVLVVAAGNDSTRVPFWPAAFPWAISVGALARNQDSRAKYSNAAGWVDVYALGDDLVNAYATGKYRCVIAPHEVRHFSGMARWSGTSFAVPVFAAAIAERMSRTGENSRHSADALLADALKNQLVGVGPRLLLSL